MSFLPYKNLGKFLEIDIKFEDGILPEGKEQRFDGSNSYLFDSTKFERPFKIKVSTLIPDKLEEYAHPEDNSHPFKVLCRIHSNDGMVRSTEEMVKNKTDFHEVSIEIDPERIKIQLNIQVVIIRSLTIYPKNNQNFATTETSKIAWSPVDKIIFQRDQIIKGGFIDIRWADFESDSKIPMPARKAMHFLKTDEEKPVLLLNSQSSQKFQKIIDSSNQSESWKLSKNVIIRTIASDVMKELFEKCAYELRSYYTEHGFVDSDAVDDEWKKEVLEKIAYLIYPETLPELSLENLFEDIQNKSDFKQVLDQSKLAVQISMEGLSCSEKLAEWIYDRGQ